MSNKLKDAVYADLSAELVAIYPVLAGKTLEQVNETMKDAFCVKLSEIRQAKTLEEIKEKAFKRQRAIDILTQLWEMKYDV